MSRVIGKGRRGVQSPADHHCCRPRGSLASRGRPRLRRVSRRGSAGSSPATAPRATRRSNHAHDDHEPDPRSHTGTTRRAGRATPRANSPPTASTPAPTRSPGTSHTTTRSRCRERRSTGSCAAPTSSPPNRRRSRRSSYIRFQAEQPNETWQADFTHWRLADGTDVEILTWLDDHSRYALSVTAHQPVTGPDRRDHLPHRHRHATASRSRP